MLENVLDEKSTLEPKKRLDEFNKKFKEILNTQRSLKMVSGTLAKRIRERNAKLIIPKYELLVKAVEKTVKIGKSIRYSPADLENALKELFSNG